MNRYQTNKQIIDKSMPFWKGIGQCFNFNECKKIWGENASHYWNKYNDEEGKNVTNFYGRLDPCNQEKLINWYNDIFKDETTTQIIDKSMQFWKGIGYYFNFLECQKILGEDASHYWNKYDDEEKKNATNFYDRLDLYNKEKLVNWYNDTMQNKTLF